MRKLTDNEKQEIQRKVEHFLAAGNPPEFLKELGILDNLGSISYERAFFVLTTISQNEKEILELLEGGGYEVKNRNFPDKPDAPGVSGGFISH